MSNGSKIPLIILLLTIAFVVVQVFSIVYNYKQAVEHGGEIASFIRESVTFENMWPLILKLSLLLAASTAFFVRIKAAIVLFGSVFIVSLIEDIYEIYNFTVVSAMELGSFEVAIFSAKFAITFILYGGLCVYAFNASSKGYYDKGLTKP